MYADADNDGVPDLAIGRFPVRTTAELDTLVAKTLAYAAKSYGRTAVAWYVIFMATVTIVAVIAASETHREDIE